MKNLDRVYFKKHIRVYHPIHGTGLVLDVDKTEIPYLNHVYFNTSAFSRPERWIPTRELTAIVKLVGRWVSIHGAPAQVNHVHHDQNYVDVTFIDGFERFYDIKNIRLLPTTTTIKTYRTARTISMSFGYDEPSGKKKEMYVEKYKKRWYEFWRDVEQELRDELVKRVVGGF